MLTVLGEVTFHDRGGWTYFDVSAVDSLSNEGIKWLYPYGSRSPISGCETFPCDGSYTKPDDRVSMSFLTGSLVL